MIILKLILINIWLNPAINDILDTDTDTDTDTYTYTYTDTNQIQIRTVDAARDL